MRPSENISFQRLARAFEAKPVPGLALEFRVMSTPEPRIPTVLCFSGLDPTGGAGDDGAAMIQYRAKNRTIGERRTAYAGRFP